MLLLDSKLILLLLFYLRISFLLCCSIGMVNMWYGLKVSIDSNDLIEQLVIEKNSNREIKLKNGEKEIKYTLLKGKSALIIFGFSNQNGETSGGISEKVSKILVNIFDFNKKQKKKNKLQQKK